MYIVDIKIVVEDTLYNLRLVVGKKSYFKTPVVGCLLGAYVCILQF